MTDTKEEGLLSRLLGASVPLGSVVVLVLLLTCVFAIFPRLVGRERSLASGEPLEVKALIRKVKDELQDAELERVNRGEVPLFELQDFELEIHFVLRNEGGIRAEVVGVGSNIDLSTEKVQKLKLRWNAIPAKRRSVPSSSVEGSPDVDIPPQATKIEGSKK